jgi:hypothetical protein
MCRGKQLFYIHRVIRESITSVKKCTNLVHFFIDESKLKGEVF